MSDELDVLRSHRPEVAGPTDDLIRNERSLFMAQIENDPVTAPTSRRKRRLTHRTRIGLALACGLVAVGGAAAGAGLIPDDVKEALGLARELAPGTLTPDLDRAVKRAETRTDAGGTIELWTAPTNGGGSCTYLRRVGADGSPGDRGPVGCVSLDRGFAVSMGKSSTRPGGSVSVSGAVGSLTLQAQTEPDGQTTVYGQTDETVAQVVALDDEGRVVASADVADGWFVLQGEGIGSVEARDARGRAIDRLPLAKDPGAELTKTGHVTGGGGASTPSGGSASIGNASEAGATQGAGQGR